MKHLDDGEIQAYLDGTVEDADSGLKVHLARCEQCQKGVRAYRMLYAGLAAEPSFKPPSDLAQAVMGRLGLRHSPKRHVLSGDLVLAGAGIAVAVIVAFCFMDLRLFIDAIVAIRTPLVEYASPSLASAHGYLSGLDHTLTFLGLGLLILVAVRALDLMLPRKHPLSTKR
jgi:hypothetical protein